MGLLNLTKSKDNKANTSLAKKQLTTIYTKVTGTSLKCAKDNDIYRKELLKGIVSSKTNLHLEFNENHGQPEYLVIMSNTGLDIGSLTPDVSNELYSRFKGYDYVVKITELTKSKPGFPTSGCNIAIHVYK